jgi:hypothetical protein
MSSPKRRRRKRDEPPDKRPPGKKYSVKDSRIVLQWLEAIETTTLYISWAETDFQDILHLHKRISEVSDFVSETIGSFPVDLLPTLLDALEKYQSILSEISSCLDAGAISLEANNYRERIDSFLCDFKGRLHSNNTSNEINNYSEAGHFFPNSHHFVVAGGNFTINSVDSEARQRTDKTIRLHSLLIGVLF